MCMVLLSSMSIIAAVKITIPDELKSAINIILVTEARKDHAEIYIKTDGKWVASNLGQEVDPRKVSWVIFDWEGKKVRHVLQVVGGNVIIFSITLGLEYKFDIPLDECLKHINPKANQNK